MNYLSTGWPLLTDFWEIYILFWETTKKLCIYTKKNLSLNTKKIKKFYNQFSWGRVRLGLAYIGLGQYLEAEKCMTEAYRIYQGFLPEHHEAHQTTLMYLSNINRLLGLYEKAEKLMRDSMKINNQYCKKSGNDGYLEKYHGQLLLDTGQYKEARHVLERCLAIFQKHQVSNHPNIGEITHNLAKVYMYLGNYEKSGSLFKISLDIFRQHYGQHHTDYALVES